MVEEKKQSTRHLKNEHFTTDTTKAFPTPDGLPFRKRKKKQKP